MADHHLKALQQARQGNWDAAHSIIQQYDDAFSSLIHAHLHRVEGDLPNAGYWYRLAGEAQPDTSTDEELDALIARAEENKTS